MSTKTSIKRIALVAVSALGFGLLSVVPAKAAALASTVGTVGTAAQSTTVGTAASSTVGFTTAATTANGADTYTTTFVTLTVPTGSSVTLADRDGAFSSATTAAFAQTGGTATLLAEVNSTTGAVTRNTAAATAAQISGATAVTAGTVTIVPDVPGLYRINMTITDGTVTSAYIQVAGTAGRVGTAGLGTRALSATTGGVAAFTFTNPSTDASGAIYRFTSSGVGSIYAATGVAANGTSANNPTPTNGSAADWSQGATWTRSNADSGTATISVTSTVAGVQTVTITGINATTGAPVTSSSINITYGAATAIGASSTAYMAGPAEASTFTVTSNAVPRSAPRASGTAIATIGVTIKDAAGAADARANTLLATISSGVGFLDVNGTAGSLSNSSQRRESNVEADDTRFVRIYSDGNAGAGTLSLTLVDVDSGAAISLGSFNYESTGSVASIAVTSTRYTIGRAGGYTTGGALTNRRAATEVPTVTVTGGTTSSPAFIVTTKDSGGRNASISGGNAPTIVSSDTTIVSGGACVIDDGLDVDYSSSSNGIGVYNCSFTTAASAKSGDKATLTVRTPDPASTTGGFLTTTYAVTVGGGAATGTETITFNKETYEPGEGMTVTLTAKDSAGNPVFDGEASPSVTFTKAVTGTRNSSIYINGTRGSNDALGRQTLFAPVAPGAFEARATSSALTAISAKATVGSDTATQAANAASDAAAEAIDAANAATDAANLAAEAADAATVAAEEARDAADAATAAVEALATEVATLMAALKAQITTLANTVAKIAKKVKA